MKIIINNKTYKLPKKNDYTFTINKQFHMNYMDKFVLCGLECVIYMYYLKLCIGVYLEKQFQEGSLRS